MTAVAGRGQEDRSLTTPRVVCLLLFFSFFIAYLPTTCCRESVVRNNFCKIQAQGPLAHAGVSGGVPTTDPCTALQLFCSSFHLNKQCSDIGLCACWCDAPPERKNMQAAEGTISQSKCQHDKNAYGEALC